MFLSLKVAIVMAKNASDNMSIIDGHHEKKIYKGKLLCKCKATIMLVGLQIF